MFLGKRTIGATLPKSRWRIRSYGKSCWRWCVKGHVNLASKSTNFDALYEKFLGWNGAAFSFEEFQYVTKMNNRADELANMGIEQLRQAEDTAI